MNIEGKNYRTIWPSTDGMTVYIIDQTRLPHEFAMVKLATLNDAANAIREMQVRGAPLIGATAAYGMALAMRARTDNTWLEHAAQTLLATRPTAVNLRWGLERMTHILRPLPELERIASAWHEAALICEQDIALNHAIGEHGLDLIQALHQQKQRRLDILTHCNAGWLATVDRGTALAPVYAAFDAGIPLHVWVDETRPRNQGASLTAWELGKHGVPHTVITDNAGGHLMQQGRVDVVMVGADRVTAGGDVCNKIGTYLKALAARDNDVPFYAAVPSPTIDWSIDDGMQEIPIEERSSDELKWVQGLLVNGEIASVNVLPTGSAAANPAFDITPARLITGIITERGVCAPNALRAHFNR